MALTVPLVVQAQPDLSGFWLLNLPDKESELKLTAEGKRLQDNYDLLVDDPSLYCTPASAARIWANPGSRIQIQQGAEKVLISYELFDLRRTIPLGDESVLPRQPSTSNLNGKTFTEMGSSFGHYAGDKLIIESRDHSLGYIRTSRGIPQGENTVAVEEIWLVDDVLHIMHTYTDESLFEAPFILEYTFNRIDVDEIQLYECTEADYDWFEELNSQN